MVSYPMQQQTNNPATSTTTRATRRYIWVTRVLLVVLVIAVTLGLYQQQAISDWLRLYGYQPSSNVAALAQETTMTPHARHLFYLNKPTIAARTSFYQYCTDREQAIVLGCYHGGQEGIYLLNIADTSELHGVMQVTAAHEMLHAAYDRLDDATRTQVDGWLQQYYDNTLKDQTIKDEVAAYKKTEPNELRNEMHSIFATEVSQLTPQLERYYSMYFGDRSMVVKEAEKYQEAFRSRERVIQAYDTQLSGLKQTITTNQDELSRQAKDLSKRKSQLQWASSGTSTSQYNAMVAQYNADVRAYNALLASLKADISRYNDLVEKRNALAHEEQQLVKELSGDNIPATAAQ